MKTTLPAQITSIEQAKAFLSALHANGESFHPEDDAATLVGLSFSQAHATQLNKLMEDIYNLPGNDGRHINLAFDPCEWLEYLDVKPFTIEQHFGFGATEEGFIILDKDGFDIIGQYFKTVEEAEKAIRGNYSFEVEASIKCSFNRDGFTFYQVDEGLWDVAGTEYSVTDLNNDLLQPEVREIGFTIDKDEEEVFRGQTWAEVITKLRELI